MNSADTTETATIRSPFGLLGLFAVHFARTRYFGVRRSRNPATPSPPSQRSSTSTACPLLALIHGARPLDGMHSAIRAMQLNDRYRGGWTFGEREWVKEPGSNKRVPRTRRSGPLVTQERPELALVDERTWAAVQQRFASRPATPKAHRSYMLSSLMHCALCGGRMQNTGGSTTRRYFGCANAQKRGGSVCTNRRNIPMAPLEDVVLGTITAKLGACMGEVRELVDERIKTWAAGRDGGKVELRQQIADTARQLANLVEVAAATGSPAVAQKIREVEARRSRLLAELAEASAPAVELPSVDEPTSRVLALGSLRDAPPEVAREQLRAIVEDGRIYCQPNLDGSFAVRWGVLPLSLALKSEKPLEGSSPQSGFYTSGCGGWI